MARAIARPQQGTPTAEELWARLYNFGSKTAWPSVDAIKQWLPYQRRAVATWLDHPTSVAPPDCVRVSPGLQRRTLTDGPERAARAKKKPGAKKKGKARR